MSRKVVIIGAGFGGLAVANLLAKAGYDVVVYEAHAAAGGRAGELVVDGFRFDTGPSWFLMPDVYEHYFGLLGHDMHQTLRLRRLDPAYKVFFEHDAPLYITSDNETNKQTFETIEPGAAHHLTRYLREAETTYHIALDTFLYDNLALKDILSPRNFSLAPRLLPALTVPIDRYVRKFFRDRRLRQLLEYPMVFLGSSPFSAPSLYRLMSHLDFTQGVFFPEGGMYQLVKELVNIGEELGVEHHYNSPVARIMAPHGVATGITLQNGDVVEADIVISNADLPYTEMNLLPPALQTYPEKYWRSKEAAPSALLLYLGVKGAIPELEHHNLFFIDEWERNFSAIYDEHVWQSPASLYVSKTSSTDASTAPEGHENIFVLVPGPNGENSTENFDTLADTYIAQLATMSGVPDLAERIIVKKVYQPDDFGRDYHAWQNSALGLSHVLRQSAFMRPANKSRKVKNLYYVGASTVPGIGLPMCLISAELVYKRIAGDTSKGRVTEITPL